MSLIRQKYARAQLDHLKWQSIINESYKIKHSSISKAGVKSHGGNISTITWIEESDIQIVKFMTLPSHITPTFSQDMIRQQ